MRPGTAMPGLDADERAQLRELLERLAVRHGLATGVHPGYRPPAARL
jgi:peptide subunit release factor 1 (eRF1)